MEPSEPERPRSAPRPAETPAEPAGLGRFAGKVALITGTGDRGIGGAIAERLAREGAKLSLSTLREPKRLFKRLERLQQEYVYTKGDVTKDSDIRQIVDRCLDEFGRIDVLVNNAGVAVTRMLDQMTDAEVEKILQVNLAGAIGVTRAVLPHLLQPGGVIVNVSSALGLGGCPGFTVYSATKAALVGFTQSLGWELAPRGIRVVAVAPGLVHSPMTHQFGTDIPPDIWKQVEACHPLGVGMPHDVASAVAFLASEDARWITGITLPMGWAPHYGLPTGFVTGG